MIEIYYKDGAMRAVCEYLLFTEDMLIAEHGETMFIGEIIIDPAYRNNGIISYFIKMLLLKHPEAKRCFFYRKEKYPHKDISIYERLQFERRARWVEDSEKH